MTLVLFHPLFWWHRQNTEACRKLTHGAFLWRGIFYQPTKAVQKAI